MDREREEIKPGEGIPLSFLVGISILQKAQWGWWTSNDSTMRLPVTVQRLVCAEETWISGNEKRR